MIPCLIEAASYQAVALFIGCLAAIGFGAIWLYRRFPGREIPRHEPGKLPDDFDYRRLP